MAAELCRESIPIFSFYKAVVQNTNRIVKNIVVLCIRSFALENPFDDSTNGGKSGYSCRITQMDATVLRQGIGNGGEFHDSNITKTKIVV